MAGVRNTQGKRSVSFSWNGDQFYQRARDRVQRVLVRKGHDIATEMLNLILDTPKTGFPVGSLGSRWWQAVQRSAPGEPPASQTGRLVDSIRVVEGDLRVRVEAAVRHAPWLEFGTERMEPRPFIRPARDAHIASLVAEVQAVLATSRRRK